MPYKCHWKNKCHCSFSEVMKLGSWAWRQHNVQASTRVFHSFLLPLYNRPVRGFPVGSGHTLPWGVQNLGLGFNVWTRPQTKKSSKPPQVIPPCSWGPPGGCWCGVQCTGCGMPCESAPVDRGHAEEENTRLLHSAARPRILF